MNAVVLSVIVYAAMHFNRDNIPPQMISMHPTLEACASFIEQLYDHPLQRRYLKCIKTTVVIPPSQMR